MTMWKLAVTAFLTWTAAVASQEQLQPNIVFFMPDDFVNLWPESPISYEALYGPGLTRPAARALMPNTERFRSESTVFTEAYVTSPICSASRFSILSGRYCSTCAYAQNSTLNRPSRAGRAFVANNKCVLGPVEADSTVQAVLAASGYETILAGKWHLSPNIASKQSMHTPEMWPSVFAEISAEAVRSGFSTVGSLYPYNIFAGAPFSHNLEWVTATANEAMSDAVDAQKPFFLYFASTVPHSPDPFLALTSHATTTTPAGTLETPPASGFNLSRLEMVTLADQYESPKTKAKVAGIVWNDQAFGSVYDQIEHLGQRDKTLMIWTMDHGQGAKESLVTAKGIRVALMVRYPGRILGGSSLEVPVINLDFAATFFEAAGVDPSVTPATDGVSWLGAAVVGGSSAASASRQCLLFEMNLDRAVYCDSTGMKLVSHVPIIEPTSEPYCPAGAPILLHNVTTHPSEDPADNLVRVPAFAEHKAWLLDYLQCHIARTNPDDPTPCDLESISRTATMPRLRRAAPRPSWAAAIDGFADADDTSEVADINGNAESGAAQVQEPASAEVSLRSLDGDCTLEGVDRFKLATGAMPMSAAVDEISTSEAPTADSCAALCLEWPPPSPGHACKAFTFTPAELRCTRYSNKTTALNFDSAGTDYYTFQRCPPECTDRAADRLRVFSQTRPRFSSGFIAKLGTDSIDECAESCANSSIGCRAINFVDDITSNTFGQCKHFRKKYKAQFLVPHPKKLFAHLRDCIADCPTNVVDRFWHAPLMRPMCESCSTRDFYASSRDHCASDCLEHGPGRCASFSYSYTVTGGGRCRHYQKAYDCKYLRAARLKDFYVLAVAQCRS